MKKEVVNETTNQAILEALDGLVGKKHFPVAHTVEETKQILNSERKSL